MSPLLRVLQDEVQIVALSFLGIVYVLKLLWIFRFPHRTERTFAAGSARAGVQSSLMNVLMPWQMESTRSDPVFYVQFALFHAGVLAAIALSFIVPYAPGLLVGHGVRPVMLATLIAALMIGLGRLARRIRRPGLRLISTPDDYLSLVLTIVFFATAALLLAAPADWGEGPAIAFFALTALFLVYVPFSKVCHYLYYPFTRIFLGHTLGHRGVVARRARVDAEGI
ncbi:MAG: hypothetical protein FJY88_04980 [Candidatus Eisenbacteria bacterium]|nr:hypothetical protein [Candidatus Eisenbacteria bacterium]